MDHNQRLLPDHLFTEAVQQRQEARANLTEAAQYTGTPSSSTDADAEQIPINHPAAFSFPTLSPDGSVDDISAPPAALSSLGARSRMADHDHLSDSASSFADSSYDLVDADELSETSNDDHETASVASTERDMSEDGSHTPDDVGSVAGEEQGQEGQDVDHITDFRHLILSDSFGSTEAQETARAQRLEEENEALDSFLTEDDLETPRQSTLATSAWCCPSPRRPIARPQSSSLTAESETTLSILLICDRTVPESEKNVICSKIASSLAGKFSTSGCEAVKLPATPNGIYPSCATIFRDGKMQVSAQQCVHAETKQGSDQDSEKYSLHILDSNGEHSSVYTIGGRIKPEMDVPALAIIYSSHTTEGAAWLNDAASAMRTLAVPTLVVAVEDGSPPFSDADHSFTAEEFINMDNHVLSVQLFDSLAKRRVMHKAKVSTPTAEQPERILPPKAKRYMPSTATTMSIFSGLIFFILLVTSAIGMGVWSTNPVAETAIRRQALTSALEKLSNATDVSKTYNLQHLVPQPTPTSTNFLGLQQYDMPYASYYQGASPNIIIISLTKKPSKFFYPIPKAVRVSRGGRDIAFNQTKLIEGIHSIVIDPAEAYGLVDVSMLTKNPNMNFTLQHNYGSRILQRQTYANAGTDISKSVNKDLTVAREAAKSLGEKVRLEISAGAAATKNVTTQLAVYVARDLQVFTNTAASLIGKIGQAGNHTAAAIRKDLMLARKDLVAFGRSIQKSVSTTGRAAKSCVPTKKTVISPLKLASDRAVGFRQKLFGGQKDVNSTSATKELSTYFQDLLKPGTTAKKPSKLRDIARCLPARDYSACKRVQAKSLSTSVKAKSLSTVPGKGLTAQETATGKKLSARDAKAREEGKRDRALKLTQDEVKNAFQEFREQTQSFADKRAAKQRAKLEKVEKRASAKAAKMKKPA
ncbi:hypothetical protein LTR36_009921 [Oleoguttula mirabilis]|uniref:Uncharacterized protein n=1 Tax=Oleoguttula mirabilis TaxID=1507867 RepID=A0AAV9J5M5_9PEZI|nr:hypothetical protein LTR36_009921 [Oleoguttula mirabilis]